MTHPLQAPRAFRHARIALDLPPAALAADMHTTRRTVDRWEAGTRAIPGPAAVLLALWYALHREGSARL